MFEYININQVYGEIFFKFPKALLYGRKYKEMSSDAKIAYIVLRDRLEYSIQNKWVDDNENVYFIFTNDELQDLLNCSKPKIIKIKKELEKLLLLKQIRQGLNKPNRLYLANLELNAHEVYQNINSEKIHAETLEDKGSKNSLLPEKHVETLEDKGSKNSLLPEKHVKTLENRGSKNSFLNLDREIKQDTKKQDTKREDTKKQQMSNPFDENVQLDKSKLQEQELLNHFAETHQEYSFLNYENLSLIQLFSDSLLDAENMIGIILRAKKTTEKKFNQVLVVDDSYIHDELLDIQGNIAKTLRRIYQKRKTDSKIESIDNYTFGSFTALFTKLLNELNEYENECKI